MRNQDQAARTTDTSPASHPGDTTGNPATAGSDDIAPIGQAIRPWAVRALLAAYGGVFVAGSLAWGMVVDGFRPDRYDVAGALVCLAGAALIMYAPRGG